MKVMVMSSMTLRDGDDGDHAVHVSRDDCGDHVTCMAVVVVLVMWQSLPDNAVVTK